MKKFLLLLTCCSLLSGCSILFPSTPMHFCYSTYENGKWGQWFYFDVDEQLVGSSLTFQGTADNFVVYKKRGTPSDFKFRITVNDFNTKKIKDSFISFQGYVEYRCPPFATNENFKEKGKAFLMVLSLPSTRGDLIKRPATIRILRQGKSGYVYNIFFDEVGFALTVPWIL